MTKIITVAQQKGGSGKTTVTAHLAVAFAQSGKRVAVIDIDPQASLSTWHRIREEKFGEGYTGLTASASSGWRLGAEIENLKGDHDIIIIDSPPHIEADARSAIRSADLIILPVQPSPTDLWATKATIELAGQENIPAKILLNRVSSNSKLAKAVESDLKKSIGNGLLKTQFGNRVSFAASMVDGRTVMEAYPGTAASDEVKKLATEVAGFLGLGKKANKKAEAA
jgi:chromosome partitioning protein